MQGIFNYFDLSSQSGDSLGLWIAKFWLIPAYLLISKLLILNSKRPCPLFLREVFRKRETTWLPSRILRLHLMMHIASKDFPKHTNCLKWQTIHCSFPLGPAFSSYCSQPLLAICFRRIGPFTVTYRIGRNSNHVYLHEYIKIYRFM